MLQYSGVMEYQISYFQKNQISYFQMVQEEEKISVLFLKLVSLNLYKIKGKFLIKHCVGIDVEKLLFFYFTDGIMDW